MKAMMLHALQQLPSLLLEVLVCLVVVLAIRLLVLSIVRIEGRSMMPTLQNRERTLCWRLPFLLGKPRRHDVVICLYPGRRRRDVKWLPQLFVKRVIALPGETIEIADRQVLINGQVLEEPYLEERFTRLVRDRAPRTMGPDEYFVMGDNRSSSNDSRSVGPLRRRAIVGRVSAVLWPLKNIRRVR